MKLIPLSHLVPGMKLAKDVYKGQTIFLSRHVPLTERVIDFLRSSGFSSKIAIDDGTTCTVRQSSRGYEIEILEKQHGFLRLEGDVYIEGFAQAESELYCVGNVEVGGDVLAFATIVCTGTLTVKGRVAGATVVAGQNIIVMQAGSQYHLPTAIVCIDFQQKLNQESKKDFERELDSLQQNINKVGTVMAGYSRQQKEGVVQSPAERAKIKKIFSMYTVLQNNRKKIQQQVERLSVKPTPLRIHVQLSVAHDVTFGIDDLRLSAEPHSGEVFVSARDGVLHFENK